MSRPRTGVAFGVLLAVVVGSGQSLTASASPSPTPPGAPGRAQKLAAEQSVAASSGRALRLGTGEKLVVKDVITDPDGSTHVRYDRTFDGLRVIGGDLVSHRDKSGRFEGVNWNGSRQVAVASTKPKLTLASASAVGTRKASSVQKTTAATGGELVVFSVGASPKATMRLAYDVLTTGVQADQTPSRLHTIVDANTGATLTSWDEVRKSGTGNGIYVGTVPVATTGTPGSYSMSDSAGNYTTDLNGLGNGTGDDIFSVPGTTFTDADNVWGNGAVSDRASAAVDAHYGAGMTFDYFKNVLGRNGIWNNGVGARSRIHYGNGYQNAFWDGSQMTYGDGAGNTHPLVGLDVAGHEMTHGVTQNTAGLLSTGDAGGLDEATSDIFGTAVEFYANNAVDTPDYLLAERLNLNGDGTPLRFMDRPSRDGVSPDCWSPAVSNLDPHYSSGPLNHWFYLASEGSGAKVINNVSYNSPTCDASIVAPIGRDKAEKIWFRSLTTYLTSGSNYAAAREAAIQSAKDLYGAASAECTGIAASFSAINVPSGAQTCDIAPPTLPGNLLRNPGFESGATSWSTTPDVIAAWGAGTAHSGSWSAWMGGYGVVHTDSISQSVTIPARATTLSYHALIGTDQAPTAAAVDTLKVRAGSTVLQTISNRDAASFYQLETVDLSAYAGKTIVLSFSSAEDRSLATSFLLDDISVTSPPSVSGAPSAVVATPGNAEAAVSWTAPVGDGGSAIMGYTVTSAPGGQTAITTGATSATVTGLTNGTAYTFTVTATNALGTSAASAASGAVAPAAVPASVIRFAGADRFATSAAIAQANYLPGVPVVYIATGLDFPDALAGGAAAARSGGPLLLVQPQMIPTKIAAELTRLTPAKIVVLGGTGAVSNVVLAALKNYTSGPVTRVAGATRYATAANLAATFPVGTPVFLATGTNFPDALAGTAAAAERHAAILLTSPTTLPADTAAALSRLKPSSITILGGTGAVSAEIATTLTTYTSSVTRISGPDRYATAAAVATNVFPAAAGVFVTTGAGFADALTGGPVAGASGQPLLLAAATCLPGPTAAFVAANTPATVTLLGGTGVLGTGVASLTTCPS